MIPHEGKNIPTHEFIKDLELEKMDFFSDNADSVRSDVMSKTC